MANAFLVFSFILAGLDLLFSLLSFRYKSRLSLRIGLASFLCALSTLSYVGSITINDNYQLASVFSSVYFFCCDLLLICMYTYSIIFTKLEAKKTFRIIRYIFSALLMLDFVVFLINPFNEIAIGFNFEGTVLYNMKPLYIVHLVFDYLMVVAILYAFFSKALKLPVEYQPEHLYLGIMIIIVILINAIYLFIPKNSTSFLAYDWAIPAYTITICFAYHMSFIYPKSGAMIKYKNYIFNNLDKGVVLFDYEGNLVYFNDKSRKQLKHINIEKIVDREEFNMLCSLEPNYNEQGFVVQCYLDDDNPLRCDYRLLKNKKNKVVGYLYQFSNAKLEIDVLTGFQKWEYFKNLTLNEELKHHENILVTLVDVNKLGLINASKGREFGDTLIKKTSVLMKEYLPKNSYFIRGNDAGLFALIANQEENVIIETLEKMKEENELPIEYSITAVKKDEYILHAADRCSRGLLTKKLLDKNSSKNNALIALNKALEETDSDTESHMQRTTLLSEELGKRLKLSDNDISELKLLAVLHDIGKIGVPLEILNKPGRLTTEEFEIVKTHAEKGYNIAKASPEIELIADYIRHHHERWDGKGYPDGLSKESIPLLSRVVSVVDSYDAMRSERPYKKPLSKDEAIEELKRCAGTQFDPHVVTEFLGVIEQFSHLYSQESAPKKKVVPQEKEVYINDTTSVHKVAYAKYVLNKNNEIISVDENFSLITGYTYGDIKALKMRQSDLVPNEDRMDYVSFVSQQIAKSPNVYFEHRLKRKNNSIIDICCYGREYYDSTVREERTEIVIFDPRNTELYKNIVKDEERKSKNRQAQWETMYRCDSLTGLLRHKAFEADVDALLLSQSPKLLFLIMDLDDFKGYNDTYGHRKGDEYLVKFSNAIKESLRDDDLKCRMGGDEFAMAISFNKDTSEELIKKRAQEIFNSIKNKAGDNSSFSMGATISNDKLNSFSELYDASDKALYESKDNGRNKLTFFN